MILGSRLAPVLLLMIMIAAACSSSATESTEANASPEPPLSSDDEPSVAFCSAATSFITDSGARFITTPDAASFAAIDTQLAGLATESPTSIAGDVTALRSGFEAIGEAYAATGYEPSASLVLPVEVQEANLRASRNLEEYLLDNCGLAEVRDTQIADIREAFGIDDPVMAECLHTQMGDIANIEASTLTPELMTAEVCGTSIFGLLSGATANE